MYKRILILLMLQFILVTYLNVYSQSALEGDRDIQNFTFNPVKLYTNKDGLPQSNIISTAIDSIGRFWVGTQDGAAVYNGREWRIVNMPEKSKTNYVQVIKVTKDSSIWFGILRGGIARLYNDKWEFYSNKEGLPSNYILSIAEQNISNDQSVIWVGTDKGVAKKEGNKWNIISTSNEKGLAGNIVYSIYQSTDNVMWFATNGGVSKFNNDKWQIIDLPDDLSQTQIFRILQTKDGALWFGGNGVVGRYDGKNWQVIHLSKTNESNVINSIHQSRRGQLLIGTMRGIWSLNITGSDDNIVPMSFNFRKDSKKKGDLIVWSISETLDGNLWFGTFLGLYRYTEGKWRGLTQGMEAEQGGTTAVIQTKNGDYYFGTENGLLRFRNGKWESISNVKGSILYLYEDLEGSLWVSVFFDGVYRLKKNVWTKYQKKDGLADNTNWFIYQTSDKAIWFGSDAGVARLQKDKWNIYTMTDGLSDNTVLCMHESSDKNLWFGTANGITIFQNGKWLSNPYNDELIRKVIFDIYEIADSNNDAHGIWLSTLGSGVYKLKPNTNVWENFNINTQPALSNNSVYRIERDKFGRLYFLTNNKITRFTFYPDGEINSEIFGTEDGLPNNEGISSASCVDLKGRIWFGTTEGAAVLDPSEEYSIATVSPLIIEKIFISNSKEIGKIYNGINLNYTQNTISFEYSLLSFFRESETKYSVMLKGYDEEQSVWTIDYKKEYSNLPAGSYSFLLWGKNYAGQISGPLEFNFTILPAWWETLLFRIVMFCSLGIIVFLSVRIYVSQKVKKQLAELERKNLIEKERTRISQDMHDTIGSKLTRIAILCDRTEKELSLDLTERTTVDEIKKKISSIGQISREIVDGMNEIIWSLSPKYDTLNNLIFYMHYYLNEILEHSTIEYKFDFAEINNDIMLTPEIRRNIFLIFKEAINNVVKHSHATSITVCVNATERNFHFDIKDNGVGYSDIENGLSDKVPKFGLNNMKLRAKSIGAELSIGSCPGKGTTINFDISLNYKK